ncbi:MAG: MerC domain-containing protein [Bacteriovoracaceae bacterium]
MNEVTFIYFEGCPEAKNVRAALLNAGVFDFKVVIQDQLLKDDPLKKFSSPSVLKGKELIYGIRTDGEIASCTFDYINFVDETSLVKRFKELKDPKPQQTNRGLTSIVGSGLSTLMVLKCPACIPGVVAFLSAIGLGFIITPTVLKSVLVSMLLITLSGLLYSYSRSHRIIYPLILGAISSIGLYIGRFYYFGSINLVITYGAVAGLIMTSLWDLKLKSQKSCSACV